MKLSKRDFHKYVQAYKKHNRIKRLLNRQMIVRRCKGNTSASFAVGQIQEAPPELLRFILSAAVSPSRFVN